MSYLSLKDVNKIYPGGVQAVYDFNLDVENGEFIVLVGPSGCGKSTTLRMIAGLEGISSGDMTLDGKRINDKAPSDRDIAMVFQDYALYGNMTVYQNVGFSLTVKKENPDKIHEAVMGVSNTVGITRLLNRYPKALSGGEKQRVAMGRSIARSAKVLLMDEPLSNLDAKLRQQIRKELALLHSSLNITIVYVTHDQVEAMTMATRMVVMDQGYVQQVGTPYDIYHYPENVFVAGFIGMPPMNIVAGGIEKGRFVRRDEGGAEVFSVAVPDNMKETMAPFDGKQVSLGIRSENILPVKFLEKPRTEEVLKSTIKSFELLGAEYSATLVINGVKLICRIPARHEIKAGEDIDIILDSNNLHFFDKASGNRIKG